MKNLKNSHLNTTKYYHLAIIKPQDKPKVTARVYAIDKRNVPDDPRVI